MPSLAKNGIFDIFNENFKLLGTSKYQCAAFVIHQ